MPERPPKKWMRDCTKGVAKKSCAKNPGAVCGDLWYHRMSEAAKKKALAREKRRTRKTTRKTGRKKIRARPTRGHARGYYALDARGHIVSGPHSSHFDAAPHANRHGGWVQYEPGSK